MEKKTLAPSMLLRLGVILAVGLGLFAVLSNVSALQANLLANEQIRVMDTANQAPGQEFVSGEIIVQFKSDTPASQIAQINRANQAEILSYSSRGSFHRLRIRNERAVEEVVAAFSRNPNVEYAEPNYVASAALVPNDPFYVDQWHLDNPVYGGINMEKAWDVQTGDPNVIVAVIDSGVAYENYDVYTQAPDLAQTSFVPGYDFINNDAHANDDHGHGTHVAGTVAQSTNNNLGVAGVAFGTTIMPIKVLAQDGYGTYAAIADGIYFAADNGAKVINMSLVGVGPSEALRNALRYADSMGVTMVCAAGNGGPDGYRYYPAVYPECITVSATDYEGNITSYSSIGDHVDVAAPGGDVTVDRNGDGYVDGVLQQTFDSVDPNDFAYWFYEGTSMATPHVAGVAALLVAKGITNPIQVREAIEATVIDKGAVGSDPEYGHGLVDAYAALTFTPSELPPSEPGVHDVEVSGFTNLPTSLPAGVTANINVEVANLGTQTESFEVSLTDVTDNVLIGTWLINEIPAGGTMPLRYTWDTTDGSIGNHTLRAEATPVFGETNLTNNIVDGVVELTLYIPDLAVLSVGAPASVTQSDMATVSVTFENQGTSQEKSTLTLTDTTDGTVIGSQQIDIFAGDIQTIDFSWDTTSASVQPHTLTASIEPLFGETDTADNTAEASSEVLAVVHDVAVQSVSSPLSVTQGDGAVVTVTVENQGDAGETTVLTLTDTTDGNIIGTQAVGVATGEVQTYNFTWDTTGASVQVHTLTASLEGVTGETDTADNSATASTEVVAPPAPPEPPAGPTLSVSDIVVSTSGWGSRKRGRADIAVVDNDGGPVAGALVAVDWYFNGSLYDSRTGTTGTSGTVRIQSDRRRASSGDVFMVVVTSVSKDGYEYDEVGNVETSDSVMVP